jgi:mannose-6-phosphate isomerase-like protein (cupin superfamily)
VSDKVNLEQKLSMFNATWTPKIIGELNGQMVKLAKLQGDLAWHAHEDEDELFLVLEGSLTIEFRDGEVHLEKGEMYIVPRGVEHNPVTKDGASVLLFEPASTKHTGDLVIERTVTDQEWI